MTKHKITRNIWLFEKKVVILQRFLKIVEKSTWR